MEHKYSVSDLIILSSKNILNHLNAFKISYLRKAQEKREREQPDIG